MASLAPLWASLTSALIWSMSSWSRVGELLLGHPQPHGQGHQLGLGAVVEIPLDPPQGGGGGVDGLGPGLLEVANPDGHGIGGEEGPHEQAVEVVEEPHRPRGDEEEDRPGDHGGQADKGPAAPRGEVAGLEEDPDRLPTPPPPPWLADPPEGIGEAPECVPPQAEGGEEGHDGQGHLDGQVGHRLPACPVPKGRLQPPQVARSRRERLRLVDDLVEQRAGQPSLHPPDAPGPSHRDADEGEPDEGDGQHHAGHHGDADEGRDRRRRWACSPS